MQDVGAQRPELLTCPRPRIARSMVVHRPVGYDSRGGAAGASPLVGAAPYTVPCLGRPCGAGPIAPAPLPTAPSPRPLAP
jgi:hypothetical protein